MNFNNLYSIKLPSSVLKLVIANIQGFNYLAAAAQLWLSLVDEYPLRYEELSSNADLTFIHETAEHLQTNPAVMHSWTVQDWDAQIMQNPLALLSAICELSAKPSSTGFVETQMFSPFLYDSMPRVSVLAKNEGSRAKLVEVIAVIAQRSRTDNQSASTFSFTGPIRFFRRKLGELTVETVKVRTSTKSFAQQIAPQPGVLRIMAVEFTEVPIFDDSPQAGGAKNRWLAKGLVNETEIINEALTRLRQALQNKTQIALFPELMCTPKIKQAIIEFLYKERVKYKRSGQYFSLELVVAGTFHQLCGDGTYKNKAIVLDSFGSEITELCHSKIHPVSLPDIGLNESISTGRTITLAASRYGFLSVLICHDVSQVLGNVKTPLHALPITLLLVSSLTKDAGAHKKALSSILLQQQMAVVVANQAGAVFRGKRTPDNWERGGSFAMISASDGGPRLVEPAVLESPIDGYSKIFDVPFSMLSTSMDGNIIETYFGNLAAI